MAKNTTAPEKLILHSSNSFDIGEWVKVKFLAHFQETFSTRTEAKKMDHFGYIGVLFDIYQEMQLQLSTSADRQQNIFNELGSSLNWLAISASFDTTHDANACIYNLAYLLKLLTYQPENDQLEAACFPFIRESLAAISSHMVTPALSDEFSHEISGHVQKIESEKPAATPNGHGEKRRYLFQRFFANGSPSEMATDFEEKKVSEAIKKTVEWLVLHYLNQHLGEKITINSQNPTELSQLIPGKNRFTWWQKLQEFAQRYKEIKQSYDRNLRIQEALTFLQQAVNSDCEWTVINTERPFLTCLFDIQKVNTDEMMTLGLPLLFKPELPLKTPDFWVWFFNSEWAQSLLSHTSAVTDEQVAAYSASLAMDFSSVVTYFDFYLFEEVRITQAVEELIPYQAALKELEMDLQQQDIPDQIIQVIMDQLRHNPKLLEAFEKNWQDFNTQATQAVEKTQTPTT